MKKPRSTIQFDRCRDFVNEMCELYQRRNLYWWQVIYFVIHLSKFLSVPGQLCGLFWKMGKTLNR